jgi:FtsP/CotA-like multicopper oxidase with cupredoxin domain
LRVFHNRLISIPVAALVIALGITLGGLRVKAQGAAQPAAAVHPEFREPVVLASKDGVLELTLTAHQGTAKLDTVATPVKNMLVFAYQLERGTASNGQTSGDNMYPAPTLQVFPGQTLIVHVQNELTGLTIRDYYTPAYTPKGEPVPIYAPMLTSSPFNLHVHGVHVSPKGNSDNVLMDVQAGMSVTYVYHIPKDMPQGAYWYHSHLHTLTMLQTYLGLAGLLEIGRVDGNLPIVTQRRIPVRNMILQNNAVFDRAGGLAQSSNYNWPKEGISTLVPPTGTQLADGTYRPSLAPVNFTDSPKGTKFATVWWAGPPQSHDNNRGVFQFIPANLQAFAAADGNAAENVPADPDLPDAKRDVQFTVNGQFEPVVRSKAGQTEIWVLENITDMAYINVELTETATGRHPKIAIVGIDGNPFPAVHYPPTAGGTELLLPPATRVAIAVTMPQSGDLVLAMPPYGRGAKAMTQQAVQYTNNGTENSPATLGTISVLPSALSYNDGFFVFPTQELARATTSGGQGEATAFVEGQKLHAYTSFVDLSRVKPAIHRTLLINGGFFNNYANSNDPKTFVYAFDSNAFPYIPLIQPRLGSVEEWTFINHNNDEHPIHVHVNDFQVTKYDDPTTGLRLGPEMWGEDNANVPAPTTGAHESVVSPGVLSMRTKFEEYTGTYVLHCHRLNHEDNGLMALINVIPAVSAYAVAMPGAPGRPARVRVYDGAGDRLIRTVTPFPGYEGTLSVAMGDVESIGVLDLIVGTGKGASPQIAVYSGKSVFRKEIARFAPFGAADRNGLSVAAAQIDGSTADNVIVGSPSQMQDRIEVYSLQNTGEGQDTPKLFTSFVPFENDRSGVTVAAGMVDLMSGRYSIVAAPGPGSPAVVKVFKLWLLTPIPGFPPQVDAKDMHQDSQGPVTTATFAPFGDAYRGGVSLGVGWIAGSLGGAQSIVVGQQHGGGVAIYSGGNALQGAPKIYLRDPQEHDYHIVFGPIARLHPFGGGGVQVGTTATTTGADLLVSGSDGTRVSVVKYDVYRATPTATYLSAKRLHTVESVGGSQPEALGGN